MSRVPAPGSGVPGRDAAAEGLGRTNSVSSMTATTTPACVSARYLRPASGRFRTVTCWARGAQSRQHRPRGTQDAARRDAAVTFPRMCKSLLLVWSRPYAVECMSVTSAFAAGYQPGFCEPGCGKTLSSPLYDTLGWCRRHDRVVPAMLLPSDDEVLAKAVIDRGMRADGTRPRHRLPRCARRIPPAMYAPVASRRPRRFFPAAACRGYLDSGAAAVARRPGLFHRRSTGQELSKLTFLPGAAADHLTSYGGRLDGIKQMSAQEWLRQGATASYGSVSEPCAHPGKFRIRRCYWITTLRATPCSNHTGRASQCPARAVHRRAAGAPVSQPFMTLRN